MHVRSQLGRRQSVRTSWVNDWAACFTSPASLQAVGCWPVRKLVGLARVAGTQGHVTSSSHTRECREEAELWVAMGLHAGSYTALPLYPAGSEDQAAGQ